MFDDIKIFAADHRRNIDWNLPYIRLGNCQSDAVNIITTVPVLYHRLLSEIAQAIDIKNRFAEFGSPSYLGLCHYRRFFTSSFKNILLVDLQEHEFKPEMCATPLFQLAALKRFNADILCFARVKSYNADDDSKVNSLIDELELYGKKVNLNMSRSQIESAFDLLYMNFPEDLKPYFEKAMKQKTIHCCNIFTSKAEIFCQWASLQETMFAVCKKAFAFAGPDFYNLSHRWFAYLSERITSVYLDSLVLSGKKMIMMPLLTINGKIHKEK